jgi:predicted transposase YdaD
MIEFKGEPINSIIVEFNPIYPDRLDFLPSNQYSSKTLPKTTIPFRMLDYRVRSYRKYPNKTMRQVVIYLKQTGSELVHQTHFTMERTHHEFEVIRLWEQPASVFLQYPGLIPFAVLGETADVESTLREAIARSIEL